MIELKQLKNKTAEEELQSLGQPMPTDDAGKMSLLWNMINEYCDIFRKVLQGKCNTKNTSFLDGEGGFKIKILYKKLLEDFTGNYKATAGYTDENINYVYLFVKTTIRKIKRSYRRMFPKCISILRFLIWKNIRKNIYKIPPSYK